MNHEPQQTPPDPESRPRWWTLLKAIVIGPPTPLSEKLVAPTYGALLGIAFGAYLGAVEGGILGSIVGIAIGLPCGALIGACSVGRL
jgi:hypothetical protein